jgi:hypothetical protein
MWIAITCSQASATLSGLGGCSSGPVTGRPQFINVHVCASACLQVTQLQAACCGCCVYMEGRCGRTAWHTNYSLNFYLYYCTTRNRNTTTCGVPGDTSASAFHSLTVFHSGIRPTGGGGGKAPPPGEALGPPGKFDQQIFF